MKNALSVLFITLGLVTSAYGTEVCIQVGDQEPECKKSAVSPAEEIREETPQQQCKDLRGIWICQV